MKVRNTQVIPQWPSERNLATYSRFLKMDIPEVLAKSKCPTWIDVGCRTGKALSEVTKQSSVNLVGVNAHPIKVKKEITGVFCSIPEDPLVLSLYQGKANLVTDIYGAFSYCQNPLETLIYESLLLKNNGQLAIYFLEERIKLQAAWKKIQLFFKKHMRQKLSYAKTKGQTNSGHPLDTAIVNVSGIYSGEFDFVELCLQAQKNIGLPKKLRPIFQPADKSAIQWAIAYVK